MDKTKKSPIEKLLSSLESRKKSLVSQAQRMTEVYETEIKKIKDKVEIIDIQINAFKNKTS